MTFTVTYRDQRGAKREEAIEAGSRAACVAACRARGISPLAIRDGRAGAPRTPRSIPHSHNSIFSHFHISTILVVLSLLAILGGAWWWLSARPPKAEPPSTERPKKMAHPKDVAPTRPQRPSRASASPNVAKVSESKPEPPLKWQESFITNSAMRMKFSVLASAQTNDSGVVTERYRLPDGRYWRRQIDPPPIFENMSDNAIAMVLGDRSGAPIPPVPGLDDANLDEAFIQSLSMPIEIGDTDSPGIAALKMAVMEAREEIKQALKSSPGRRVGEILQEHIELTNHQADMTADALKILEKVRQRDGDEAAEEYAERINERLKSFGMPPIKAEKVNRRKQ